VPHSQRFAFRGLGAALSNLLLATLFFSFAYAHLQRFLVQPRLSLLLIVAVEGLVVVTATTFQVVRILQEEHLLLQYPDYARYSGTTRWRLVPAIW